MYDAHHLEIAMINGTLLEAGECCVLINNRFGVKHQHNNREYQAYHVKSHRLKRPRLVVSFQMVESRNVRMSSSS